MDGFLGIGRGIVKTVKNLHIIMILCKHLIRVL